MLLVQCCHGDVMHVSELLDGRLVVDCHLLHLTTHNHRKYQNILYFGTRFTQVIPHEIKKTTSHDVFLSPAPVDEFSVPPSLSDAPLSGVLSPPGDPS